MTSWKKSRGGLTRLRLTTNFSAPSEGQKPPTASRGSREVQTQLDSYLGTQARLLLPMRPVQQDHFCHKEGNKMTVRIQKNVIEMWHKAWPDAGAFVRASAQDLERFAELVRADEREACLQIADQCADADMHSSMAANAIRARTSS